MLDTLIIGFGYKQRHGKDTAAKAIIETRGEQFDIHRYAFADELKREVNRAAELSGGMLGLFTKMADQLPAWVTYESTPDMTDPLCPLGKQRTLLQWWGTEYRRAQDKYYWVKKLDRRIALERPRVALITDMRFPNEYYWVQSKGGITVKVERHGYTNPHGNTSHSSETALDGFPFDYEINVLDGELEQLKKDAVTVFDMIYEGMKLPELDFSVEAMEKQETA